jgi:hypothetical protein
MVQVLHWFGVAAMIIGAINLFPGGYEPGTRGANPETGFGYVLIGLMRLVAVVFLVGGVLLFLKPELALKLITKVLV